MCVCFGGTPQGARWEPHSAQELCALRGHPSSTPSFLTIDLGGPLVMQHSGSISWGAVCYLELSGLLIGSVSGWGGKFGSLGEIQGGGASLGGRQLWTQFTQKWV